jgi:hypothetical protein
MTDRFSHHASALTSPASDGFSITPHDGNNLPEVTRALFVGGAGSVNVHLASGAQVNLSGVSGGTVLPIRVRRVLSTGTTATAIIGLL